MPINVLHTDDLFLFCFQNGKVEYRKCWLLDLIYISYIRYLVFYCHSERGGYGSNSNAGFLHYCFL